MLYTVLEEEVYIVTLLEEEKQANNLASGLCFLSAAGLCFLSTAGLCFLCPQLGMFMLYTVFEEVCIVTVLEEEK